MDNLLQEIAAEKENIERTLKALDDTLQRPSREFVELAAIATCLHNAYNGIENLLKRTLKYLKITLPHSDTSHKDLLGTAVAQGIISQNLRKALMNTEPLDIFLYMVTVSCYKKHLSSPWQKIFSEFGSILKLN